MKTLFMAYIITNGQCTGVLHNKIRNTITNAVCNIKSKKYTTYRKATKKEIKIYLKLIEHKL